MRPPRRPNIRSVYGPRPRRKPRSDRIDLNHESLHRYFWRHSDERDRLPIYIAELAELLGVGYEVANNVVIAMRNEGRIRAVAWKKIRIRVYQISDPDEWRPRKPETHALAATEPVWG